LRWRSAALSLRLASFFSAGVMCFPLARLLPMQSRGQ
jgi:hypothetical protein